MAVDWIYWKELLNWPLLIVNSSSQISLNYLLFVKLQIRPDSGISFLGGPFVNSEYRNELFIYADVIPAGFGLQWRD